MPGSIVQTYSEQDLHPFELPRSGSAVQPYADINPLQMVDDFTFRRPAEIYAGLLDGVVLSPKYQELFDRPNGYLGCMSSGHTWVPDGNVADNAKVIGNQSDPGTPICFVKTISVNGVIVSDVTVDGGGSILGSPVARVAGPLSYIGIRNELGGFAQLVYQDGTFIFGGNTHVIAGHGSLRFGAGAITLTLSGNTVSVVQGAISLSGTVTYNNTSKNHGFGGKINTWTFAPA